MTKSSSCQTTCFASCPYCGALMMYGMKRKHCKTRANRYRQAMSCKPDIKWVSDTANAMGRYLRVKQKVKIRCFTARFSRENSEQLCEHISQSKQGNR